MSCRRVPREFGAPAVGHGTGAAGIDQRISAAAQQQQRYRRSFDRRPEAVRRHQLAPQVRPGDRLRAPQFRPRRKHRCCSRGVAAGQAQNGGLGGQRVHRSHRDAHQIRVARRSQPTVPGAEWSQAGVDQNAARECLRLARRPIHRDHRPQSKPRQADTAARLRAAATGRGTRWSWLRCGPGFAAHEAARCRAGPAPADGHRRVAPGAAPGTRPSGRFRAPDRAAEPRSSPLGSPVPAPERACLLKTALLALRQPAPATPDGPGDEIEPADVPAQNAFLTVFDHRIEQAVPREQLPWVLADPEPQPISRVSGRKTFDIGAVR